MVFFILSGTVCFYEFGQMSFYLVLWSRLVVDVVVVLAVYPLAFMTDWPSAVVYAYVFGASDTISVMWFPCPSSLSTSSS